MKDKPALAVLIVVLTSICLVVLLCMCVFTFVFPVFFTTPTASPPNSIPATSPPPSNTSPTLSASISPDRLMEGTEAHIHIQMSNPGKLDLQDYTLNVWYGAKNDSASRIIQAIPLSSESGEGLEDNITWVVDYISDNQINYELRLVLLKPDTSLLTEISVPFEIVEPIIDASIDPSQLTPNSRATIHIQVKNPSDADMQGYILLVGYSAKGDTSMFPIQDIDLSLAAGQTFEQNIAWDHRSIPPSGDCQVQVILLLPDGTLLTEIRIPFVLNEK